jgi:hypothetical protein
MSVSDIFSAFGGNTAVARVLGVGPSTTSEMKRRGRIPAEYWCDLVDAAQRQNIPRITLETLAKLHARKLATPAIAGFAEDGKVSTESEVPATHHLDSLSNVSEEIGHFSRWKHLRRHHFASEEEIVAHVRALRDEWDRR